MQALLPALLLVDRFGLRVNEDDAILDNRVIDADIVSPRIEGAAARQIEACVVPVAGEDAVADAAAMQWKTHVRAAVVDSIDLVTIGDDGNAVTASRDDARFIEFLDSSHTDEPVGGHSHSDPLSRDATRRPDLTPVSSS